MSNGLLSIEVPVMGPVKGLTTYKLNGHFKDGRLRNGTLVYKSYTLTGTFNESLQLHGANCKKQYLSTTYTGTFENGKIIEGTITYDKFMIEEGSFVNEKLRYGLQKTADCIKKGEFRDGHLLNGSIVYKNGNIHVGIFDNSTTALQKGTMHNIHNNFTAYVEVDTDYLLTKCYVNYDGNLHHLRCDQLLMYCCSGESCEITLPVYRKYFSTFTLDNIVKLINVNLKSVNIKDQLGLKLIIDAVMYARPLNDMSKYYQTR
jgi:hypothetical protein